MHPKRKPITLPKTLLEHASGGFDEWGSDYGGSDGGGYGSDFGGDFGNGYGSDFGGSYGGDPSWDFGEPGGYSNDPWGGTFDVGGAQGEPFAYDGSFDYGDWWTPAPSTPAPDAVTVPAPEVWTAPEYGGVDPSVGGDFDGSPPPFDLGPVIDPGPVIEPEPLFEPQPIVESEPIAPEPWPVDHASEPAPSFDSAPADDLDDATGDPIDHAAGDESDVPEAAPIPPLPTTDLEEGLVPPILFQGNVGDCSVVAALNSVASTSEGYAYLESLVHPNGDGTYTVDLRDAEGALIQVQVSMNQGPGEPIGGAGPLPLQVLERAIGIVNLPESELVHVYSGTDLGNMPSDAMRALGLETELTGATNVIEHFIASGGVGAHTIGTRDLSLDRLNVLALADQLEAYNLVDTHAYVVKGTYVDERTGDTMVELSNPWGYDQPSPVPLYMVPVLFGNGGIGMVPPNPSDPPG